jgi:DNA-binding NarL/FixJ family response regulator
MSRVRVLLAGGKGEIDGRERVALESHFDVVGDAQGKELGPAVEELKPDIVLFRLGTEDLGLVDAVEEIAALSPGSVVVFAAERNPKGYWACSARGGRQEWVVRSEEAQALGEAVEGVINGHKAKLSERQKRVVQMVAEGKSAKQMAAALGLSVKTVEFHKAEAKRKLGVDTLAELTRYAMRHGLVGK